MAEIMIRGLNPHAPSFRPLPKQPFFSDYGAESLPIVAYYSAPPPPPSPNPYHCYSVFYYFHQYQSTTSSSSNNYCYIPFPINRPTYNHFAQPPKPLEAVVSDHVEDHHHHHHHHHQTHGGGEKKPANVSAPRPPRLTRASSNTTASPGGHYRKHANKKCKHEKKKAAELALKPSRFGGSAISDNDFSMDGNITSFGRYENHRRLEVYSSGDWLVPKFNIVSDKSSCHLEVLHVERDGRNTTVMIRNIPNKYTRDMLMDFLDNHCAAENEKPEGADNPPALSAFDFFYLPIDFHTGMNKGYAFVNFTNPEAVWKFYLAADGQSWDVFKSLKIRQIAYAKIQGMKELVSHFDTMGFPCGTEDVLPVCFEPARDGSRAPVQQKAVGRPIYRKSTSAEQKTQQED